MIETALVYEDWSITNHSLAVCLTLKTSLIRTIMV